MKRATSAKISLVLVSLSGAGSGDRERQGGLGGVDRRRSNGLCSAGPLAEKWPPRSKFEPN